MLSNQQLFEYREKPRRQLARILTDRGKPMNASNMVTQEEDTVRHPNKKLDIFHIF